MASEWFGASWSVLGFVVVSTIATYLVILVGTRLNGVRTFSKMSSTDFAITVAFGSLLATISVTSTSLAQGAVGLATLFAVQHLVTRARRHDNDVLDNDPVVIMAGGEVLEDNMRRARVTVEDVRAKLREANVVDLDDVACVIVESTGDVAVLHGHGGRPEVDRWIVEGVRDGHRIPNVVDGNEGART